ncbi:MAG: homogentisate 1,2-dioxygenase [Phyllobacteriaceae bacterium]|nr:homogentisate 1,2-dioxygenase [Phyllobacteriaceae bacterium]
MPPDLAAWANRAAPVSAAASADRLTDAVVPVGRAVDAALLPTRSVAFVVRPGNPGGSVAHAGLFRLSIPHAGTWRVAIAAHAWIEVVVDGKPVDSVAHGGGPACAGIAKVVDYDLPAGDHVLMLSASDAAVSEVLVVEKR